MSKTRMNSKSSPWIDDFKYRQARLREILALLDRVSIENGQVAETLVDEQLKALGIHLADLDLKTGKTTPSVTRHFMPAKDNASGISSNNTKPIDDEFTSYNESREKKICGDEGWPGYHADAFYSSHARNRDDSVFISRGKQLTLDGTKRGRFIHVGHCLDVASGGEYSSGRSLHRVVFAVMDIKTQSVGELILLVSWMLAGMQYQESAKMRRRHKKYKTVRLHVVFSDSRILFYAASSGSSTFWLF